MYLDNNDFVSWMEKLSTKLNEIGKVAEVVNNHSKIINNQIQIQQKDNKKLLKLISLYSELANCGIIDSKRKENLKAEIMNLINE